MEDKIKKEIIRNACIVLVLFIAIAMSAFCVYKMIVVKNETDKRIEELKELNKPSSKYADEYNEKIWDEMNQRNQGK